MPIRPRRWRRLKRLVGKRGRRGIKGRRPAAQAPSRPHRGGALPTLHQVEALEVFGRHKVVTGDAGRHPGVTALALLFYRFRALYAATSVLAASPISCADFPGL